MIQTTLRDYLQNTEDALSAGRINEALEHCQHVLSYFPESLEAQRLLGEIYMAQGHLDAAQQTFDWVLTNDPENVIAYCNRALISERMEDLETALDCYQQAYELSRGNSQIRQEFNLLSARIGQQDFMFSRAGLARLYMRGDLLPQAIQEWEVVLATAPERMDARIGLLEAYWREGAYEQVEQLANQILEEIPGSLKALLLLAYAISSKNSARARELVQRAEALDPEITMAQELFSDLIASQPDNPFLALIKKNPVQLSTADAQDAQPVPAARSADNTPAPASALPSVSDASPAEPIFGWNSPDIVVAPSPDQQPVSEHPQSDLSADSWSSFSSPLEAWGQNEAGADSWQSQLGIGHELESGNGLHQVTKEAEHPTPPAWLDTLTRQERQQSSGELSAPDAPTTPGPQPGQEDRPTPGALELAATASRQAEPEKQSPKAQQDMELPFPFASEDNDIDMGWPEWLKSLGAEEIEKSSASESEELAAGALEQAEPVTRAAEATPIAHQAQPVARIDEQPSPAYWSEPYAQQAQSEPANPWLEQLSHPSEPEPANPWLSQLTHTPQPAYVDPWATPAASMEQAEPHNSWLEQLTVSGARAEQPEAANPWLGQLAPPVAPQPDMDQHVFTTLENLEYGLRSQGFVPLEPGALSSIAQETQSQELPASALAQPDRFEQPVANLADMAVPASPTTMPATQPAEPLWPATPASRPDRVALPTYRADTVLDNELETTMKRPAFRLQPMQQRPALPMEQALFASNGPTSGSPAPKPVDGNLSYRERLLRGYQCQLAGAYDDAMQEYRVIIRNAPDLLGDVISNTRALLKLAPKYSIGYRVLGDAYMRQGEYLQAMEAYNKALTMAKRAKGQGN
ncbi:MAG: tetratricopeptide repeat protein [Ktedonobacteraceae bacterium]|nr:tetratricopeptide repeat protein [Ktedonobacteraceae bacterium]